MSNELKVGVLTVVSLAVLYWGFNFLKGMNFFKSVHTYHLVYDEVNGLLTSNPVKINGLIVGRVHDINVLQDRNNLILVSIQVNDNIVLNKQTLALLKDDGLLGGKFVELKMKKVGTNLTDGDTLVTEKSVGLMDSFTGEGSTVVKDVSGSLASVNQILDEYKGLGSEIRKIVVNANQITQSTQLMLAQNQAGIQQITTNLSRLTASLVETEKEIKPLLSKFNSVADSLKAIQIASTIATANKSLAEVHKSLQAINQQQGTLGKLVYNDSLYNNLNRTLADLDSILVDFKVRPKRYIPNISVFGKTKDKK